MFPEQKTKSSVLAISKIFLAAIILISISTVMGAAGYLAINNPTLDKKPQVFITPGPTAMPTSIVKDESTDLSSNVLATEDWKTYRNDKYGYELKYPRNWNEKESSYNDTGILFLNTNKEIIIGGAAPDDFFSADGREINPKYTNDWIGIQIDTYSKPVNFSWGSWIKSNFSVIEKYEKFNYQNLTGIKIIELSGIFYGDPSIFIEGDKIYNIKLFNEYPYNMERDTKRDELALNYFNQIISTFKFIGKDESFSCGTSTVSDIDNNIYRTVQIGSQCWLKENLKVTNNPVGKRISRYCLSNNAGYCDEDGGLYDWYTVMNGSVEEGAQGICPRSWHIPADSEWYIFENYLKDEGQGCDKNGLGWNCDPAGAKMRINGSSGFDAHFTGYRDTDQYGTIHSWGLYAGFWSSSTYKDKAWYRFIRSDETRILKSEVDKLLGEGVRCLKD